MLLFRAVDVLFIDSGLQTERFPVLSRKPALKLAIKSVGGDGAIERGQLAALLPATVKYHRVLDVFDYFDTSGDRSLSLEEFAHASKLLELFDSEEKAKAKFAELDDNCSGSLSLDEFVAFAT